MQKTRAVITAKMKFKPSIDRIIKETVASGHVTLMSFKALPVGNQKMVKINLEPQIRQ